MNRTHRTVWSHARQTYVAAPALLALGACLGTVAGAADLPTGGNVVAGSGTIAASGNAMTIQQSTSKLAVDWQSFSIGPGKTVEFVQPSSSAVALNRVLGTDVSVIQGALKANGQVFLVNPNGVLFTKDAQVNVGGVVASTLNISTTDFLAGNYRFEGASSNAIVNQGRITAAPGGNVALIAARISNTGQINAEAGKVLMGAGSKVRLDLGGPVKIEVEQGALDALIEQGGGIRADGGLVYLTAKALGQLTTTVINHTGITEARTLATGEKGEIYLMGGMDKDRIVVDGRLDASAPHGGHGGFVETSAATMQINSGTQVTTLAAAGNAGTWLIDPTDFTISSGSAAQSDSGIGASTLSDALNSGNVTIQTVSSGAGNGDILVSAAVTKTSGSATTLTLAADRSVLVSSAIAGSSGSPLNVVLAARARGGATGQVKINSGASVKTYGGDITIGGGDTAASGYAIQTSGSDAGVRINGMLDATSNGSGAANSTLPTVTSGGNITIRGKGDPDNSSWFSWGVQVSNGQVITGGSGNIEITGYGGKGGYSGGSITYAYFVGSVGVTLETGAYIKSNTGNITIKGYKGSGGDQYGIANSESSKLIGTNGWLLFDGDSLMLRDGALTVFAGQASDIKVPIVGCSGYNYCTSNAPNFAKSGAGTLNLWGDAEAWNNSRPANTAALVAGAGVFTDDNSSVNVVGITATQALYAFASGSRPAATQVTQSSSSASGPTTLTPTFSAVGGAGSLLYYNGNDYSLNSYWSASSVFGANSGLTLGTDYNFLYNNAAVTSFRNAGAYSVTLNLLNTTSYTFGGTVPTATFTITPKTLTITGLSVASKTYDASVTANVTDWGSVSTGVGNETLVLNRGTASFASASAGANKAVTASGYSLSNGSNGGLASNYQLASSTVTTTASINASAANDAALAGAQSLAGQIQTLATPVSQPTMSSLSVAPSGIRPRGDTNSSQGGVAIASQAGAGTGAQAPGGLVQSGGLLFQSAEELPGSGAVAAQTAGPSVALAAVQPGRDPTGFMRVLLLRGGINTQFDATRAEGSR